MRLWLPLALCALAFTACNPYTRYVGDSNAGAVDPVYFPAAYLGDGGVGAMPGMGVMNAVMANAAGVQVGYYTFPFTAPDLSLSTDGMLNAPVAYDFDEDGAAHCVAPANYVFDQERDAVRYNEQGNIFTQIPDGSADPNFSGVDYEPVVADVAVHSNGEKCQALKSEITVVASKQVTLDEIPAMNPNEPDSHPTGKPSGVFYARPVIDPSIDVRGPIGYYTTASYIDPGGSVDPNTGLGPQQWGWYQRYLLAYLDGGAIPTLDKDVVNSQGGSQHVTEMVTQQLFFPAQHPGDDGAGNTVPVPGALGDGFDVLTATRADMAYSPLCQVFSFVPVDPMNPETSIDTIDMSTAQPASNDDGSPMFVWCIQLAKPVTK